MPAPTVYRDIAYWPTFEAARVARDSLRAVYPDCRIVHYQRGYAVQRERSGPYLGPNPEPGRGTPGGYALRQEWL